MAGTPEDLERRVVGAAEAALAESQVVSPVDVLIGLGWLAPSHVAAWRQGRIETLEGALTVSPAKLSAALRLLERWAHDRGLVASETAYVARTHDRRALRFGERGDADVERAYRTHWLSPELSVGARERLAQRQSQQPELVVIVTLNDWTCTACGATGDLLIMDAPGPLCLACADLDHLVFLPAGDAAVTRRAKRASRLSAVVVRFSRARRRYERQGLLVEEEALESAEQECLADAEARARRRLREVERRGREDADLCKRLAAEILRLYPAAPGRAPRRSPATPPRAAAAALAAAPPAAASIRPPSSWLCSPPSGTKTPTTTRC